MKLTPLILFFALGSLAASAQTTNAPVSTATPSAPAKPAVVDVPQPPQPGQTDGAATAAQTTDPAKIAEFQGRFTHGQELEQAGKLADALAVFDGIIAEAPDAKGSLREAGLISMSMGDLARADGYFEKLHQLVPDYPMAIESLIQINQGLKRDVKVAILNKQFHELRAAGKVPNPYFIRERIDLSPGNQLVMTEFFDYKEDPNTVWMGEVFDSTGTRQRWFLLNYDPDATKALIAKNPQVQSDVFNLYENVYKNTKLSEIDVYKTYTGTPDYRKARLDMLAALSGLIKPLYTVPVPPDKQ